MKTLNTPVQFFHRLVELYTVKDETDRRSKIAACLIVLAVSFASYLAYLYFS